VNNGTITTYTTVSSTLTNIFNNLQPNSSDELGLVIAAGVVTLDAPLTIPADAVLDLQAASTFANVTSSNTSPRNLIINGVLTTTNNTALALQPPENITVSSTGRVGLGTSGSLTIASTKTFDISSPADETESTFSGSGANSLKAGTGTAPVIIIDGVSGYGFDTTTGVTPDLFKAALADIKKTVGEILVDKVELSSVSHFYGQGVDKVLGTVDLASTLNGSGSPLVPITSSDNAAGDKIPVPSGISIVVAASPGITSLGGVYTTNLSNFSLGVNIDSFLTFRDITDKPTSPSPIIDKFGVLKIVDYTVAKNNLVSPKQAGPIHVGVKSLRNN
jgi:hypothetical protein